MTLLTGIILNYINRIDDKNRIIRTRPKILPVCDITQVPEDQFLRQNIIQIITR